MTEPGADKLIHATRFDQAPGEVVQVSPRVRRIVEDNPGPFTFTGTCTYLVGRGAVTVIDPGRESAPHLDAILAALKGERVAQILVSHTHKDHSPGARALAARTGAPILGCAPYTPKPGAQPGLDSAHDRAYAPARVLNDGERVEGDDHTLTAVATPGHAANHLAFALEEERALFSADHVMAWATTIVAPPDGSMRDYMASLDRLRARADVVYWPGHGGPVNDPQRYVRALRHHRRQREAAILTRLEAGDRTVPTMVARIYEGLDPRLAQAAGLSLLAHLEDLAERGVVLIGGPLTMESEYRLA